MVTLCWITPPSGGYLCNADVNRVSSRMRAAATKLARPEWATRIEKLRDRFGSSQTEFAKKLDVSAMAVSRWERGVNEPPANGYIALGKLAGRDGCWFFWERAGITKSDVRRVLNHS